MTGKHNLLNACKEAYWTATRAVGLGRFHGKEKQYIAALAFEALFFILFPFYVPLYVILRILNIRFINVPCLQLERIGHFAADIDCYLKDQILAGKKVRPVLICVGCKPNTALLTKWSTRVRVIKSSLPLIVLRPLFRFPILVAPMMVYNMVGREAWDPNQPFEARRGASRAFDVQNRWADRPPLLDLSEDEILRGRSILVSLGVPRDAWFVCIHSREGGYSPNDEWSHDFRNTKIEDFILAIEAIAAQGGWCIRMGDPSMVPLRKMPNTIDYAKSTVKSDWMDVFLCAQCSFFLGTSSGLCMVASVFGRPAAITNLTPLACVYAIFPRDISIPKILLDRSGLPVSWSKAFSTEVSELRLATEFAQRGFTHVDNTPDEIAELAQEMMARSTGSVPYTSKDECLQSEFKALLKPYHFAYHAKSRIGRSFLQRHSDLLN